MTSAATGGPTPVLIIAGHLVVDPAERDAYVASCIPVVHAARAAPGCLDFSITADTLDLAHVRIHERWEDEAPLLAFRGSGPSPGQQAAILHAEVRRYEISAVGDP
jgi:quinol monooxygenase YgiN